MFEPETSPDQGIIIIEDDALRQGFTQIPNAVLRSTQLSPGAKLTYMGLLSFAWQKGSCFPGQEQLAQSLGLGKRTIIRHLQELRQMGLLRILRRGLGKTNVYMLPRLDPNLFSDERSANLALQEMPKTTHQEVPIWQIEQYSKKNTKIEKYPEVSSRMGSSQLLDNSNQERGLGETQTLTPNSKHVENPAAANISLAPSELAATSEPYPNDPEETSPTIVNASSQRGLRRVGETLAQRVDNPRQSASVGLQRAPKSPDLGSPGLEDSSPTSAIKPGPRRRGRPRRVRADYLDAVITDFSREFHDEEHLPSNLSQARNLLQASGLEQERFVQNVVYPARSIVREQGNIRKHHGDGSPLRNKMPYFFACIRDQLGIREDAGGPVPPIHQSLLN